MMDTVQTRKIPTRSWGFWIVLLSLFTLVIGLTMWKDWWVTGEEPSFLFYLIVPAGSMLGGVLCMFWVVKVRQLPLTFLELLAVMISVNLVMQGMEIVLKMIYHLVWEYPGWLYIAIVFPVGFLLGVYGLVRWGGIKWGAAAALMAVGLAGELLTAGLISSIFGLTTPGS